MNPNYIFEKNLFVLENQNPELAAILLEKRKMNPHRWIKTPTSGLENILLNRKTPYFPQNKIAEMIDGFSNTGKNEIFPLFFGIGTGKHIRNILEENIKTIHRTLIVETDPFLLITVLEKEDFSWWMLNRELEFILLRLEENSYVTFYDFIKQNNRTTYFKGFTYIPLWNPVKEIRELYSSWVKNFQKALGQRLIEFGNCPKDTLLGINNIFNNLDYISESAGMNNLIGKFQNIPAVIVAAGPSLNQELSLLKANRKKVLLISCDTGLKILEENGMTPDFVTSIERIQEASDLFSTVSTETLEKTSLVVLPVVMEDTFKYFQKSPKFLFERNDPVFMWLKLERGTIETVGSSANAGFELARNLGCNPIILLGQDLCFSPEGKTHAKGAFYGEEQDKTFEGRLQKESIPIDTNAGTKAYTQKFWMMFLRQYETLLQNWGGLCITTSLYGAKIPGTKYLSFQECVDQYLSREYDFSSEIRQIWAEFVSQNSEEENIRIKKSVAELINKLQDWELSWLKAHDHLIDFMKTKSLESPLELWADLRAYLDNCITEFMDDSYHKLIPFYVSENVFLHLKIQNLPLAQMEFSSPQIRLQCIFNNYYIPLLKTGSGLFQQTRSMLEDISKNWSIQK